MASRAAGDGLTASARRRLITPGLAVAISAWLSVAAAGCAAAPGESVTADWRVVPAEPIVDTETQVEATLLDGSRQPIRKATVTVEAHMSHPGMAPVVEPAVERGDGVYAARLRLSMPGTWTLFVQVESAGRSSRHRLGEIAARPPY